MSNSLFYWFYIGINFHFFKDNKLSDRVEG
jgi:hypothetical protein